MLLDEKPYTLDRLVRLGFGIAIMAIFVFLIYYLRTVLIPFAIAVLLAYLMNPFIEFIQKKIKQRTISVFITLFISLSLLFLAGWLIIPYIVEEIANMGQIVSALISKSELAENAAKRLPSNIWLQIQEYLKQDDIQQYFQTENFQNLLTTLAKKLLPGVWSVITSTTTFLLGIVGLIVILLYLIFLLLDFNRFQNGWKELVPIKYRKETMRFLGQANLALSLYFRGQSLVALSVGILFAVGFRIIDLPMAIVLGLFVGLLNMIPYLQIIGLIPAFILAAIHAVDIGQSFWAGLGQVALVFVVVQGIQETILVPKIMGKITGLSPAVILLSLSIWGKLLGFLGLLLAIPITALLWATYNDFLVKPAKLKNARERRRKPLHARRPKKPN